MRELGRRLLKQENLPRFEPVDLTLAMLVEEGKSCQGFWATAAIAVFVCATDWWTSNRTGQAAVLPALWTCNHITSLLLQAGGCRSRRWQPAVRSIFWAAAPVHAAFPPLSNYQCRPAAGAGAGDGQQLFVHLVGYLLLSPALSFQMLPAGRRLVQEQEMVNSMRLSDEYLKKQRKVVSRRLICGLSVVV